MPPSFKTGQGKSPPIQNARVTQLPGRDASPPEREFSVCVSGNCASLGGGVSAVWAAASSVVPRQNRATGAVWTQRFFRCQRPMAVQFTTLLSGCQRRWPHFASQFTTLFFWLENPSLENQGFVHRPVHKFIFTPQYVGKNKVCNPKMNFVTEK